jgi:hypothetical protein
MTVQVFSLINRIGIMANVGFAHNPLFNHAPKALSLRADFGE